VPPANHGITTTKRPREDKTPVSSDTIERLRAIELESKAERLAEYWQAVDQVAAGADLGEVDLSRKREDAGFNVSDTEAHLEMAQKLLEANAELRAYTSVTKAVKKALAKESKLIAERDASILQWDRKIEKATEQLRIARAQGKRAEQLSREVEHVHRGRIPLEYRERIAKLDVQQRNIVNRLEQWQEDQVDGRKRRSAIERSRGDVIRRELAETTAEMEKLEKLVAIIQGT